MSVVDCVKLSNGKIWGIGDNILNIINRWFLHDEKLDKIDTACVIIPINQLSEMTDEEIGRTVKLLIPEAKELKMTDRASNISEDYHRHCEIDQLIKMRNEFSEFKGKNGTIDQAIIILDDLITSKSKVHNKRKNLKIC